MIDSTPSVLENPLTLPCLALEKKKNNLEICHMKLETSQIHLQFWLKNVKSKLTFFMLVFKLNGVIVLFMIQLNHI